MKGAAVAAGHHAADLSVGAVGVVATALEGAAVRQAGGGRFEGVPVVHRHGRHVVVAAHVVSAVLVSTAAFPADRLG